jgi:hypothetical protein
MEPEDSLPRLHEVATCRYPEHKAYMYALSHIIILHTSSCSYVCLCKLFSHALQLQKD